MRSTKLIAGIVFSIAMVLVAPDHTRAAELWPQRTVTLIVPFSSGSGIDIAARVYAEQLAIRWKQPVVVENRPGAEGLIGVTAFAALRDDHRLLFSPAAPISVYPFTQEKIAYDPAQDLVPISLATNTFCTLAAAASADLHSIHDLIDFAHAHPGKLNWASGGGAFPILFAGFARSANLDLAQVSYRQQNIAMQDLAEGRIHVFLSTLSALLPTVRAGKVRLLAMLNKTRAPIAPDVSTSVEQGVPALEFDGLAGFFGWRDMPSALRDRIATDIRAVSANPGIADRLAKLGQSADAGTPEGFAAAIDEQRSKIREIARLVGKSEH
jgi:tripartite-type tricarboxylate transporter receptor subunit TctC